MVRRASERNDDPVGEERLNRKVGLILCWDVKIWPDFETGYKREKHKRVDNISK